MAARVQPRQLAFALPHAESLTRDNFLEGPANAAGLIAQADVDGFLIGGASLDPRQFLAIIACSG